MKMIKFDLRLRDAKVTNLEELQENFCSDILPIFQSGKLAKWLKSRELTTQAQSIEAIDMSSSEMDQLVAICRVLDLDDDPEVLQFLLDDRAAQLQKAPEKSPAKSDGGSVCNSEPEHVFSQEEKQQVNESLGDEVRFASLGNATADSYYAHVKGISLNDFENNQAVMDNKKLEKDKDSVKDQADRVLASTNLNNQFELSYLIEENKNALHDGEHIFVGDGLYSQPKTGLFKLAMDFFERNYADDEAFLLKGLQALVVIDAYEQRKKNGRHVIDINGMYITDKYLICVNRGNRSAGKFRKILINSERPELTVTGGFGGITLNYEKHSELKPRLDLLAGCINSYLELMD